MFHIDGDIGPVPACFGEVLNELPHAGDECVPSFCSEPNPDLTTWARAVAAAMSAPAAQLAAPGRAFTTPKDWRTGGSPLTMSGGAGAIPDLARDAAGSSLDQLTLHLDGGRLGELSVTFERTSRGLRITIGASKADAMGELGSAMRELLRGLRGHGVQVSELRLLGADGSGTSIALAGSTYSGAAPPAVAGSRLKLVG